MADISSKQNNSWTSKPVLRGHIITVIDKGEQKLDSDEAGTPRCVDSLVGWFMSLHSSDVPTWQEFVSKVCPKPELRGKVLNMNLLVAFGHRVEDRDRPYSHLLSYVAERNTR